MKKRKSFILYTDYLQHIEGMSDQEIGQLFRAIMLYASGREVPEMKGFARMAFSFISLQMDRDNEKWEDTCQKRREAVNKRWTKQKNTNEYKSIFCNTNDTDTDTVTENDTDTVTDTDNENETVTENDMIYENDNVTGGEAPPVRQHSSAHSTSQLTHSTKKDLSPETQEMMDRVKDFFDKLNSKYGKPPMKL